MRGKAAVAVVGLFFLWNPGARAGQAEMEARVALGGGEALDRWCGVRDCAEIRLFWYQDLEAAKAEARKTGKPILSLRLMGRLDEELSCANSRFFRTVFYKNTEINKLLREKFVLHWRSVRPVPKVTIDFGDGTRLERTLTGNSIHYVLDSQGRVLDALPGLYSPEAFRSALVVSEQAAREAAALDGEQFASWLVMRHSRQVMARNEAFERERASLPSPTAPPAALATASKAITEISLLGALGNVNDEELQSLGKLRRPRVRLDAESRAFLVRKHGVSDPKEAERLIDGFETTVALDEVINEYRTGPAILNKLMHLATWTGFELEAFNLWVYEEVFRTPLSDPWLGLAPEDVYTALPAETRRGPEGQE